jgi:enterochelin esterase family protein
MTTSAPLALLAGLLLATAPSARADGLAPCGSLSDLRARLAAAKPVGGQAAVADDFAKCAARAGTPLLRHAATAGRVVAFFVCRSSAARVFLAGDTNGWSTSATPFEKLPGTDLHALELELSDGARVDYKLVVGGTEWTLDPWNPKTMTGGYGPNSELRTPAYRPPPEVEPRPGLPEGRFEELSVASRALGGERRAIVWVLAGCGEGSGPLPSLYLLDGTDYRDFARAHVVAANLVAAGTLRPLLLVLVPPVDRRVEYERSEAFERFLVSELVPAVEARFPARRDPAGRGVMGVSLGAFAALSASARHPEVFGRCGAQSTANGVPANLDALIADLARLPAGAARFHFDVGTYEAEFHGSDLVAASRRLRSALAPRQAVQYREVPEGHSWGSWRARLSEAWTFFWGDARPDGRDAPRALEARAEGVARFTGAAVDLDVKDADLGDVVRTLTAARGLSVVAPADLKGTVTATLRDVPWDQALDLALAGNGWAFVREGTVIRIVRRGEIDR